jgi:hypothetical protein
MSGAPDYKERCKIWDIQPLEVRRIRGDLIQKFKFNKDLDSITWHTPIQTVDGRCDRGPQLRREIVKNCDPRHYFFNTRVANQWNALPSEIVNAASVNEFKNKLDKMIENNSNYLTDFI